ncbi:Cation transporter/ATPase, N-terminus [Weissella viridescens]|uniref:Cation transporter/ATPase, N-terminus n=1 Tax=Weissella viridescens TaxID=1629 RepID=A0A380P8I8_WEIVI|nr:Cation transporter/ATPase, N-terminus [Weissella viridescens]
MRKEDVPLYQQSVESIETEFQTNLSNGLDTDDVEQRLEKYGDNALTGKKIHRSGRSF